MPIVKKNPSASAPAKPQAPVAKASAPKTAPKQEPKAPAKEDNFKSLLKTVQTAEIEHDKFYNKGVKASGARLRAAMQNIKILAQNVRVEVQELKNS